MDFPLHVHDGPGGIGLKIEAQEKEAEEWGGRAQPTFETSLVRNIHCSQVPQSLP